MVRYFYAGPKSTSLWAGLLLVNKFLEEDTFNYLRTERELGYFVASRTCDYRGVAGLEIAVQSSVADPARVSEITDIHLKNMAEKANNFS